jgi:hypothetical protein
VRHTLASPGDAALAPVDGLALPEAALGLP